MQRHVLRCPGLQKAALLTWSEDVFKDWGILMRLKRSSFDAWSTAPRSTEAEEWLEFVSFKSVHVNQIEGANTIIFLFPTERRVTSGLWQLQFESRSRCQWFAVHHSCTSGDIATSLLHLHFCLCWFDVVHSRRPCRNT